MKIERSQVLLRAHQKRETFSLSLFCIPLQGSTPPLTNIVTYPHCFDTAFTSNVTPQPNSRERGGASDSSSEHQLRKNLVSKLNWFLQEHFSLTGQA